MASSKKKDKRRKNEQKRKRRKEKHKAELNLLHEKSRSFMFGSYLVNCDEAIDNYMAPPDGLYSRIVHEPEQEKDIYPTSLWNIEGLTASEDEFPKTLPKGASLDEQWEQVKDYSPSFNLTQEGAAGMLRHSYETRKTPKQKNRFLERKGDKVKTYRLTPEDGLIQKEPDEKTGHVVFQPYEGFKLEEHAVDNVPSIPLISFYNNEEK